MSTLEKYSQDLEDLLYGWIAESRKEDEKVPLENVIEHLKKCRKVEMKRYNDVPIVGNILSCFLVSSNMSIVIPTCRAISYPLPLTLTGIAPWLGGG